MFDYRRGDFDGLRSALQSLDLSILIQDDGDINNDWLQWKDAFLSAVADYIPTKKIKGKNSPPWITGDIIHSLRKKEAIRQKLKKSPTSHLREKFKELRTKVKHMIRESRASYFDSLDISLQPKRFWSIFRMTNKTSSFPDVMSTASAHQDPSRRLLASTTLCQHFTVCRSLVANSLTAKANQLNAIFLPSGRSTPI